MSLKQCTIQELHNTYTTSGPIDCVYFQEFDGKFDGWKGQTEQLIEFK